MKEDKVEITINTDVFQDGVIVQSFMQGFKLLFRQTINVNEKHFKEALCKLGWKPPKEIKK